MRLLAGMSLRTLKQPDKQKDKQPMQERNQQKASVLYNELESLTPFNDSFSVYLFKKTEKIVLALYLVTDHLQETDSMRLSIRSLANEILKDGIKVTNRYGAVNSDEGMISRMYEVSALLEIAGLTKLVAPNNAHIIKDEIARLAKDIKSHQDAHQSGSNLKKSFFVVDTVTPLNTNLNTSDVLYKGQTKGHTEKEMSFIKPTARHDAEGGNTKVQNSQPRQASEKNTAPKEVMKRELPKKDDRTDKIVSIIQEKGQVTIKDITEAFVGISEKTIQRELQRMVLIGVLKKEGERRWSTYSLL
jgi:hypothetical protein